MLEGIALSSARFFGASTKVASAPASTNAAARSSASLMPLFLSCYIYRDLLMSLENTLRVLRDTLLYRSFFHVFSIRGIYTS